MSRAVHPTAIIDPSAQLGSNVEVGPYCVIEADVTIGDGCVIGPLCRFMGPTVIGPDNRFVSHVAVGADPQDLKFDGEATRLEIGARNTFREFVTLNRGTPGGGGVTRIADDGLYMAYAHIAHDCQVGSNVIFANAATLAGHVEVADNATIGAFSAIHQFCRVGRYAFLGGFTVATKDCLPFMRTVGSRPAKCYGPNSIGLERQGFDEDQRRALKRAWRHLHSSSMTAAESLAKVREELSDQPDVAELLEFIDGSERGVVL